MLPQSIPAPRMGMPRHLGLSCGGFFFYFLGHFCPLGPAEQDQASLGGRNPGTSSAP